jgi:hypothetical protein
LKKIKNFDIINYKVRKGKVMDKICEHDKREIEKLKQWVRYIRGDKMPIAYLHQLDKSYARILTLASFHNSFMEVERKDYE